MKVPYLNPIDQQRETQTSFGGYNAGLNSSEIEYEDMQNMTSDYAPLLSPRNNRGICRIFNNPQGVLAKESLFFVDGDTLYNDNNPIVLATGVTISTEADMCPKYLAKMGALVLIMPDKIWYNVDNNTSGYMEASFSNVSGNNNTNVAISLCDSFGNAITSHNEAYYKQTQPQSGDYCISVVNGKSVLKQWADSASMWVNVATVYVKISCTGIGRKFDKGDGIKITADMSNCSINYFKDILVNDLGNNQYSANTVICNKGNDYIIIVGIIQQEVTFSTETSNSIELIIERKVPDMQYITECNNRLWGCSSNGHEIYASKLGDAKNWNVFAGNSMDSWAATIGTDGKWTGAITFNGYPTFFKADSLTKVAVASNGGHQTRDLMCRGVERGSERSLVIINEVLYYKSNGCICAYDGSIPQSLPDVFGDKKYSDAIAGACVNKYYISMKDKNGAYSLFVYDTKKGMWHKEDNTHVIYFCKNGDELFFISQSDTTPEVYKMQSVNGSLPYEISGAETESDFDWYVQTRKIGIALPDNRYYSRFNIKMTLEANTEIKVSIRYDDETDFTQICDVTASDIKRKLIVPIIPKRCDIMQLKIWGHGAAKIYSVSKIIEQGSDI